MSEMEAKFYYGSLDLVLVARTSTTPWEAPTDPEACIKELRPGSHPALRKVWNSDLGPKVCTLLKSMEVKWTSINIVRIVTDEEYLAPVILWIGVRPASLSGKDGVAMASKCRELLVEYDIDDVDVEIHESVVTRL